MTAVLVAALMGPAAAEAAPCGKHYDRATFHRTARQAFAHYPYTAHELKTLRRVARCQKSAKSRRLVRWHYRRYARDFRQRYSVRISGRVSWFGGPSDGSNQGTALGVADTVPGVAIRPYATYQSGQPFLGGYWYVCIGRCHVVRQTDIGPHQSTGRRIDVTSGAVPWFGYSTSNFPTDSIGTAVYLGRRP